MFYLSPPRNTASSRQLFGVLSNGEIAKLLAYISKQELADARISNGKTNTEVRRSKVAWLPINDDTNWLYNSIAKTINRVNEESYNYSLTGLQLMQYTEYHDSDLGTYGNHLDWHPGLIRPRKLSLCVQLSDDRDYVGGDLQVHIKSDDPIIASRNKGDALIFPSFLLHGVTPVTSGIRKSLVVWVEGPEWK